MAHVSMTNCTIVLMWLPFATDPTGAFQSKKADKSAFRDFSVGCGKMLVWQLLLWIDPMTCAQVLNLLLYGLTGRPVDEQLMVFLAVDEHLVDIGDDLVDYEASTYRVGSSTQISEFQRPCTFARGLLG